MKRNNLIATLVLLLSLNAYSKALHFPEEREYTPKIDAGFKQYNTPSLYYSGKYVLTFDDGPHPTRTPKILDELKKYGVKATFFVLTKKLNKETFPIFKRILDEGHIVSSHLHKHFHSNILTEKEFEVELKKSIKTLIKYYKKAGHKMKTAYFRFPYAEYGRNESYHHMNVIKRVSQQIFKRNCINFAFWDLDSADWIPSLTEEELLQNIKVAQTGGNYTSFQIKKINGEKVILKKTKTLEVPTEGGVILFHDIQEKTKNAIGMVLEYFKQNNLDVVPLDQVEEFSYKGTGCFK